MKHQTQRTFTDIETGEIFELYMDSDTHEYFLHAEGSENLARGSEVNGFYICAHTSSDVKINGKKIVHLPSGSFYNLKEGEQITHRKFCGFTRFQKV